jgi:hypothetical protein
MVTMKSSRGLPSALAEGCLLHPVQPDRQGENAQLAVFHRAQIGGRVKDRSQLLDVAFVHAVEIVLDDGLYGRTIMAHGLCSFCMIKSDGNRYSRRS